MYYDIIESPIGPILLAGNKEGLKHLIFLKGEKKVKIPEDWIENKEFFREAARQLEAYFSGELESFDLKLAPEGTDFQKSVWKALCEIPYGETRTYTEIAVSIGKPRAYRAVGLANNRNPIAIIIPCHRVIGTDGKLTGYASGLDIKEFLLKLEEKIEENKWQVT
ncbi:methylated-DNA--[protein]-cysteine S-methyltransferase [Methanosarcina sp. UBA411]|uniref:methylated-DNA--[protein]-cysteine S-methyltransferase n=1 Tax=Methanosarcina sp. UBA411 TaxID=1915589 RepID=UPI0025E95E22|nr:methylated-DNA--[protein]-cysteine S-methyltransferase [Methanosarcina sp. UBA411]